jgi:replicative superfamily II helicase
LAQGVNFPLAAVVVETLKVPQRRGLPWRPLTYAEFWNIAGRCGPRPARSDRDCSLAVNVSRDGSRVHRLSQRRSR